MARIKKVEPLVYEALVNNPQTRSDDFILILEVLNHFVTGDMTLKTVLENHVTLGIPSIATIVRSRRKIQEKNKDLVNPVAKEIRAKEEEEFKEYAKV